MCFHFRGSIKPIFENHVFRPVSEPFHPLYEAKISNRSLSVVYGSITLKFFSGALGTSPHQWFNRRNEIQKKCFLGHPIVYSNSTTSSFWLTNWRSIEQTFFLDAAFCLQERRTDGLLFGPGQALWPKQWGHDWDGSAPRYLSGPSYSQCYGE